MKYKNLNTGAETSQFSEADWKSGQPQRNGWVLVGKEPKTVPKDIIDTVFKKKVIEPVIVQEPKPVIMPEAKEVKDVIITKPSKPKSNGNPKQARRTPGKHK